MHQFCEYCWRVLKMAFGSTLSITRSWTWIVAYIVLPVAGVWIGQELRMTGPQTIMLALSSLGLIFLVRLLFAPFWIYREDKRERDNLVGKIDGRQKMMNIRHLFLAHLEDGRRLHHAMIRGIYEKKAPWKNEFLEWIERVHTDIATKISEVDAEYFLNQDVPFLPQPENSGLPENRVDIQFIGAYMMTIQSIIDRIPIQPAD